NAATPFFTPIIAHLFTRDESVRAGQVAGVTVALAGVAWMVGLDALAGAGHHVLSEIAVLGAALSYGVAGVWGRRLAALPALVIAAAQTLIASVFLIALVLINDGATAIQAAAPETFAAVLSLGALCTAVAYVLYFE